MTKKRPVLDKQDRAVVEGLDLPWRMDEGSKFVRVSFHERMPVLMNFLKSKGYQQIESSDLSKVSKAKLADFVVHIEFDGWRKRDEEKSYVEIRHPELNAFIQRDILNITPQQSRSK